MKNSISMWFSDSLCTSPSTWEEPPGEILLFVFLEEYQQKRVPLHLPPSLTHTSVVARESCGAEQTRETAHFVTIEK